VTQEAFGTDQAQAGTGNLFVEPDQTTATITTEDMLHDAGVLASARTERIDHGVDKHAHSGR
jgi:hypothetical protein